MLTLRAALKATAAVALTFWLAGCAAPGGPQGEAKDRMTASDQTDADRRARTRLELASAYFARGQTETALDEVKQALAARPDLADAYTLRGLIYAQLGDDRLSDESFRRSLAINPNNGDTLHNIGWVHCQRQQYPQAFGYFRQAMAVPQYAGMVRTLLAQGVCQARAGQWPEAEQSLMRSFELDPANPVTAVNLSEVLYRKGDYERARFYVRRVNSVADQVSAQTLWLAARIEKRLGNGVQLKDLGDQLRQRFPQSPETQAFDGGRFDE